MIKLAAFQAINGAHIEHQENWYAKLSGLIK